MGYSLKRAGFHEWLAKSNFSFLVGASTPYEMLERASGKGYQSICLNDFDGAYGLARAHLNLKERVKGSLKLHYGAEIHLQQDHKRPLLLQETLTLVATNKSSYRRLCQILSTLHQEEKTEAFLSLDQLCEMDVRDLVAIKPMRGGFREGKDFPYDKVKEHFKGNFYQAITRLQHPGEDYWIEKTLSLIKKYELPVLISQDAFFHSREEKNMQDLLNAIRLNQFVGDCEEQHFPNAERHLHSLEEIEKLYSPLPLYEEAIQNSLALAESIDFSFDELKYQYPSEMIPTGFTSQAYLEKIVETGMKERLGVDYNAEIRAKVWKELALISKLNFADYFLTVWDVVRFARSEGILCQGRGSAANAVVCFALGITSIKPNEFDLLFERFISEERGDPPDIDVDFEHERREEVIQYIYRRYGRARASMVANVICFRSRGAMRAVGKALAIPEEFLGEASELKGVRLYRGKDTQFILEKLRSHDKFKEFDLPWEHWLYFSEKLLNFPRHLGIHSGGFILSGESLDHLVPREPATMEGRTVIQWCKDDIEGLGFFKIDILALGMLTALAKGFKTIKDLYGVKLGLYEIPADDKETYQMIQRAETVGTFQIESRAQMTMLPRLKPKCLYDLVIEVAIIRPGPIQGKVIHPFLRRRDGLDPVTYPDPRLKPILERTLGIAIFQEQAMRMAVEVGNFTPGEADQLRKNIGSWNMRDFDQKLAPLLVKLESGMKEKGISEEAIDQIVGQMKGFAEYGFPESHAISFAMIAYASCYLKCHYPAVFYLSVLNSQPMGFYTPHALIQTAKREGVKVLPPSIQNSFWDSSLEKWGRGYALRMGLRLVKGLSEGAARELVVVRENLKERRFKNFDHFLSKAKLYRDDLASLASADVFQDFKLSRSLALWKVESVPERPLIDKEEVPIEWREEGRMEQLQKDFRSFGTSLHDHPARVYREDHWDFPLEAKEIVLARDLLKINENIDLNVFGMVTVKQSPPTAKGMVFITLEDETGFLNIALDPYKYAAFHEVIDGSEFLCLNGRLQFAGDYRSLLVNFIYPKRPKIRALKPNFDKERNKEENILKKKRNQLLSPRNYH